MVKLIAEREIYRIDCPQHPMAYSMTHDGTQELWHRRLGHLNLRSMSLLNKGLTTGMKYIEETEEQPCLNCVKDKIVNRSAKNDQTRSWSWYTRIYVDQWKPQP